MHSQASQSSRRPRGFTLLEIIVVVTIIALLATIIAPRLLGNVDKARVAVAKAGVNTIAKEVDLYCLEHNQTAPAEDFDLSALTTGEPRHLKPGDLLDPWLHDYGILIPGPIDPEYNVVSYGADGQAGGEGYAADIFNH